MNEEIKYYFVSYSCSNGFGCITVSIKGAFFLLMDVCNAIKASASGIVGTIVIMYYKEISEEEYLSQNKVNDSTPRPEEDESATSHNHPIH